MQHPPVFKHLLPHWLWDGGGDLSYEETCDIGWRRRLVTCSSRRVCCSSRRVCWLATPSIPLVTCYLLTSPSICCHTISSKPVYHMTSSAVTPYHIICCHTLPHHLLSHPTTSSAVTPYHIICCHTLPHDIICCHTLSFNTAASSNSVHLLHPCQRTHS
jgi:hypothetical protein